MKRLFPLHFFTLSLATFRQRTRSPAICLAQLFRPWKGRNQPFPIYIVLLSSIKRLFPLHLLTLSMPTSKRRTRPPAVCFENSFATFEGSKQLFLTYILLLSYMGYLFLLCLLALYMPTSKAPTRPPAVCFNKLFATFEGSK
jgi:hypothetical protein